MRAGNAIEKMQLADDLSSLMDVVNDFGLSVGMDGAYLFYYHPAVGLVSVDRRPIEWLQLYEKKGFFHYDPIVVRALKGGVAFTWDDCYAASNLSKQQKLFLQQSRDFGLKQGYNVMGTFEDYQPFTCCFYNAHFGDFSDGVRSRGEDIEAVGLAAKKRMQAILLKDAAEPVLTARERECLELAAAGKTNEVIGALLGISGNTVGSYIKSAAKKLGVASKIQAVVKAIQLKIIFPIV